MTRTPSCQVESEVQSSGLSSLQPPMPTRRRFVQQTIGSIAGLTCADFLGHFFAYGMPAESKATRMARDATRAAENQSFSSIGISKEAGADTTCSIGQYREQCRETSRKDFRRTLPRAPMGTR